MKTSSSPWLYVLSTRAMSEIIIHPTSGSIGAEIHGVNLSTDQSDDVFSWLCQIYKKSLVFNLTCKTCHQIYTPINIYESWEKLMDHLRNILFGNRNIF